MAEGWARALRSDQFDAYSAGILAQGLNPRAVQVMKEVGVDISSQWSKTVEEFEEQEFDYVVTVCGNARETCPLFLGQGRLIHHGFDDPPRLAETAADEDEALDHYRRVRDEIRAFVQTLPECLEGGTEEHASADVKASRSNPGGAS